ncbi:hypothetical protein [Streptomyces sp. NPDC002589]|uniref:hypothetical protein n=1 Tax=unclassified Streptomyces TaxID=2593676 RepID=UPI00332C7B33
MPLLDLEKMTAGLSKTWAGFLRDWDRSLRSGVSGWVAPLVAPAVDLSVLALLLAIRYLALAGASAVVLRPARRLLLLTSFLALALNVTEPLLVGAYGRAADPLAADLC